MRPIFTFSIGLVFGLGLCLSGMTLPSKVLGFLDVAGAWDPSLAFVMGGAVAVGLVLFRLARGRLAPPSARIDRGLVTGSALFGVGWGLVGFCPGPALAALGSGEAKALAFVAAMIAGTLARRLVAVPRGAGLALGLDVEHAPRAADACGA